VLLLCPDNGNRGRVGAEANLEQWLTSLPSLTTGESKFGVTFDWEVEKLGVPGAVIVKNHHTAEFFLKTITLDDVTGRGTVTFVANSWVYPVGKYRYNRVFFSNDVSHRDAIDSPGDSICCSSLSSQSVHIYFITFPSIHFFLLVVALRKCSRHE